MKQLYSVLVLAVGVVAMPALADGHGDHRKGGERMGKAVKQMDANNDGAISFDEFRMPEGRDAPEMRMDANGDGEITREEVSNVATQRTEERASSFCL
jgi:Ca2+-binding EF-hand superfamily protein